MTEAFELLIENQSTRDLLTYYLSLPALWDNRCRGYHTVTEKVRRDSLLNEMANQLGISREHLKRELRKFRSKYRRELRRMITEEMSSSEYVSSWCYFELMDKFLRPVVIAKLKEFRGGPAPENLRDYNAEDQNHSQESVNLYDINNLQVKLEENTEAILESQSLSTQALTNFHTIGSSNESNLQPCSQSGSLWNALSMNFLQNRDERESVAIEQLAMVFQEQQRELNEHRDRIAQFTEYLRLRMQSMELPMARQMELNILDMIIHYSSMEVSGMINRNQDNNSKIQSSSNDSAIELTCS